MSDKCWRGCGQTGDYIHIFWDCPRLKEYWENIKREIERICKEKINLELQTFLLGIIPNTVSSKNKKIVQILITIAKKAITVSWLKPQPPSRDLWWERVKDVVGMENVTAKLRFRVKKFQEIWAPVLKEMDKL